MRTFISHASMQSSLLPVHVPFHSRQKVELLTLTSLTFRTKGCRNLLLCSHTTAHSLGLGGLTQNSDIKPPVKLHVSCIVYSGINVLYMYSTFTCTVPNPSQYYKAGERISMELGHSGLMELLCQCTLVLL